MGYVEFMRKVWSSQVLNLPCRLWAAGSVQMYYYYNVSITVHWLETDIKSYVNSQSYRGDLWQIKILVCGRKSISIEGHLANMTGLCSLVSPDHTGIIIVFWLSHRALDTVHQALITHTAYTYLITHFGDYLFLLQVVKYVQPSSHPKIWIAYEFCLVGQL